MTRRSGDGREGDHDGRKATMLHIGGERGRGSGIMEEEEGKVEVSKIRFDSGCAVYYSLVSCDVRMQK
jgi:hypothetical protein